MASKTWVDVFQVVDRNGRAADVKYIGSIQRVVTMGSPYERELEFPCTRLTPVVQYYCRINRRVYEVIKPTSTPRTDNHRSTSLITGKLKLNMEVVLDVDEDLPNDLENIYD